MQWIFRFFTPGTLYHKSSADYKICAAEL